MISEMLDGLVKVGPLPFAFGMFSIGQFLTLRWLMKYIEKRDARFDELHTKQVEILTLLKERLDNERKL